MHDTLNQYPRISGILSSTVSSITNETCHSVSHFKCVLKAQIFEG